VKHGDAGFDIDEIFIIKCGKLLIYFAGKNQGALRVNLFHGGELLYLVMLELLLLLLSHLLHLSVLVEGLEVHERS
jgi:hypothetical protein